MALFLYIPSYDPYLQPRPLASLLCTPTLDCLQACCHRECNELPAVKQVAVLATARPHTCLRMFVGRNACKTSHSPPLIVPELLRNVNVALSAIAGDEKGHGQGAVCRRCLRQGRCSFQACGDGQRIQRALRPVALHRRLLWAHRQELVLALSYGIGSHVYVCLFERCLPDRATLLGCSATPPPNCSVAPLFRLFLPCSRWPR